MNHQSRLTKTQIKDVEYILYSERKKMEFCEKNNNQQRHTSQYKIKKNVTSKSSL